MADQFNDGIPVVTNQITEDVADIAETLGFLKDCFQTLVGSTWSNTDASGLLVEKLAASLTFGGVTKTCAIVSPSLASSIKVTGLTAGGIYKVTYMLTPYDTPDYGLCFLKLRFKDDSNANYKWCGVTSLLGSAITYFDSASSDNHINIVGNKTIQQSLNDYIHGTFTFSTIPGDNTITLVDFRCSAYSSTGTPSYISSSGMGFYNGSASVTEYDIYDSGGGKLTGNVITERIG